MNYQEAKKTIQTNVAKEGYMLFNFSYSNKLVLPHKAGVVFLESLALAEQLHEEYQKAHYIGAVDRDFFTTTLLSRHEYEQYKLSTLLGISLDDLKAIEIAAREANTTKPILFP